MPLVTDRPERYIGRYIVSMIQTSQSVRDPVATDAPPATPDVDVTRRIEETLSGAALAMAAANVIMQLAQLPVGRGVAESRVDSGRLDLHPIKRGRTTLSYLVIALLGTEQEQAAMRSEVNRSHRGVRSRPEDPVAYNAFDPDLQLWVAACLYVGVAEFLERFHGPAGDAFDDAFYQHCARLGTTLQVPADRWPADREAFREFWDAGVQRIEMDDVTRGYLRDLAGLGFLPAPVSWVLGPLHRFITAGFLPPRFREELGLPWSARRERMFEAGVRVVAAVNRLLPGPIRRFPFNVYARDVRRRIREGRPIV